MSVQAMHSAATGMEAFAFKLDTIANNLANAGTTAFKRSRVNFEDLYYEHLKLPGLQDSNGKLTPTGIAVGLGTRVASTTVEQTQGQMLQTGGELDIAIAGDGMFRVVDGSETFYTRAGNFSLNADGEIVMSSADKGRLLDPAITIPQGTLQISISGDGTVAALVPPGSTLTPLGQIEIVTFLNPQGLLQRGNNLYSLTDASGSPQQGVPGIDGRGELKSGFLELSNVEPVQELIELIKTQRNFELNSQVVQAADQTLQLIANLRRF